MNRERRFEFSLIETVILIGVSTTMLGISVTTISVLLRAKTRVGETV